VLVQPDRVCELPRGAVRGSEILPRAGRIEMVRTASALVIADRLVQDGDRFCELVRGDQGMAEIVPGCNGAGMIFPGLARPGGQDLPKP